MGSRLCPPPRPQWPSGSVVWPPFQPLSLLREVPPAAHCRQAPVTAPGTDGVPRPLATAPGPSQRLPFPLTPSSGGPPAQLRPLRLLGIAVPCTQNPNHPHVATEQGPCWFSQAQPSFQILRDAGAAATERETRGTQGVPPARPPLLPAPGSRLRGGRREQTSQRKRTGPMSTGGCRGNVLPLRTDAETSTVLRPTCGKTSFSQAGLRRKFPLRKCFGLSD